MPTITFKLAPELATALRELAEENERPVSGEIRRALRRHLNLDTSKTAPAGGSATTSASSA